LIDTSNGPVKVVSDRGLGAYSVYMTKVNPRGSRHNQFVFYKLQVLHQANRDIYLLFTRWGRIGERGQFQQTPFPNKESCIAEFKKVFKSKSGNEWGKPFERNKLKYAIQKLPEMQVTAEDMKDPIVPFDLNPEVVPPCSLPPQLQSLVRDVSDFDSYVDLLINDWQCRGCLTPPYLTERKSLLEAKTVAQELMELFRDEKGGRRGLLGLGRDNQKNMTIEQIIERGIKVLELNHRIMNLLPSMHKNTSQIKRLYSSYYDARCFHEVLEKIAKIEPVAKVIMGALYHQPKIHPYDYVASCFNVRMLSLAKDHPEYRMIAKYSNPMKKEKGKEGLPVRFGRRAVEEKFVIKQVLAVERRGEAERFEIYKNTPNRMLLWFAVQKTDILPIMLDGLHPSEFIHEDSEGINLEGGAITFSDSLRPIMDWENRNEVPYYRRIQRLGRGVMPQSPSEEDFYCYMLLCEVALGQIQDKNPAEHQLILKKPNRCLRVLGEKTPDHKKSLYLANGCEVPLGPLKPTVIPAEQNRDGIGFHRFDSESNLFYLADPGQVRIRYFVEVSPFSCYHINSV
jgi:predicted DNA-binding WGR domain protein